MAGNAHAGLHTMAANRTTIGGTMKPEIITAISIAVMVHICSTIWWASAMNTKVQMNEHDILRLIHRVDKLDEDMGEWQLKQLGE